MRRRKRLFKIVIALAFSLLLTVTYMPVFAVDSTPKANITVTNLKANAAVSQKELPKSMKIQGYRRVKLTWSSSAKAEQYQIYCSKSKKSSYKLLTTVTAKSAKVFLPQKVRYIKVRAYNDLAYGPYSSWVSVRAGYPNVNATKIKFTSSPGQITVGYKKTYKAKSNGYVSHGVRWASSNTNIATINSRGVVKAKSAGTVKIIATAHDGVAKSTKIITIDKYPASVTITGSKNKTIPYKKSLALKVKIASAVYPKVSWSSSNTSVATVNSTGKVTGKRTGTAVITVIALGGAKSTTNIEVIPSVESYVRWALKIASNNAFGYSMNLLSQHKATDRACPFCHDHASKDYDCASFVVAALAHGLQDKEFIDNCKEPNPVACGGLNKMLNSDSNFKYMGKLKVKELVRGDILINPDKHVEIYIGNCLDVAAHDDYDGKSGESTKDEIYQNSTLTFTSSGHHYTRVYRYVGK